MTLSRYQRAFCARGRLWMGLLFVSVLFALMSWKYREKTSSLLGSATRSHFLPPKELDRSRSTTLLSVDETLLSPNGAYALAIEHDGELVLRHISNNGARVWWTGTGDTFDVSGRRAMMTRDGRGHSKLEFQVKFPDQQDWTTVWHSDMVPSCHDGPSGDSNAAAELALSDSGRLHITKTCDLYVPASQRQASRSLAVIVAGLYRTNPESCKTQMQAIIGQHAAFAQVDVFAYMLYEEGDVRDRGRSRESIEAEVRACYGPHLRRVEVHAASDIEEDYPGGDEGMKNVCGDKLRRLNNQLKTIDQAGRMWRSWAMESGRLHDTVLRLRPDTGFRSDVDPPFWSLQDLGQSRLVLVHVTGGHYFYCARMDGEVGVGTSDQVAYGSPLAMSHWLSMHRDFREMVDMAVDRTRPAHRDFSGCEELPTGPKPEHCGNPAVCSIECLVPWHLNSRGISFGVEWGWNETIFR